MGEDRGARYQDRQRGPTEFATEEILSATARRRQSVPRAGLGRPLRNARAGHGRVSPAPLGVGRPPAPPARDCTAPAARPPHYYEHQPSTRMLCYEFPWRRRDHQAARVLAEPARLTRARHAAVGGPQPPVARYWAAVAKYMATPRVGPAAGRVRLGGVAAAFAARGTQRVASAHRAVGLGGRRGATGGAHGVWRGTLSAEGGRRRGRVVCGAEGRGCPAWGPRGPLWGQRQSYLRNARAVLRTTGKCETTEA